MLTPLEFTVQTARQAGDLLLSFYQMAGINADFKSDHTAVTQADFAADKLICEAIKASYPDDLILSEESNPGNYAGGKPVWIIDPLDGTANFSLGLPIWGVSIARVVDGYPQVSVLNFPMVGELYAAERGQGATINGQPIHPIEAGDHTVRAFFSCCSRTVRHYNMGLPYKARIFGAAAYTFGLAARGNAAIGLQTTPKVWDLAAGWLIAEESGILLEPWQGKAPFPLDPALDYANQSFPTVMAAKQELIELAREKLSLKK